MSELTIFHRIFDMVVRPAKFPTKKDAPILERPYRAQIHHAPDGKKVHISLPCARYGWWFIPLLFAIFGAIPTLILAWALGWGTTLDRYGMPSGMYWTATPMIIASVILVILIFILLRTAYPRISIIATADEVTIGKLKFNWEHLHGLRLGYMAGGKERELRQGPFHGLRMSYGPWGYDLPYMAREYYAAAYVVWVNMMLQTIDHVPFEGRVNSLEEGFKKDLF